MIRMRDIIVRRRPSQPAEAVESETPEMEMADMADGMYDEDLFAEEEQEPVPEEEPRPDLLVFKRPRGERDAPVPAETDTRQTRDPAFDLSGFSVDADATEEADDDSGDGRRNIWDMVGDDDADTAASQWQSAPAPSEPPAAPRSEPALADGRIRTRLLGFHANDLNRDVFAAPEAPAAPATPETRFPVGWVVVVEGPGRGASFTLTNGLSTIGRGADQTIALDFGDSSISRNNHASIAYDEEENLVFIGHGGKSNIVRLNGRPLLSTEELHDGDHVRIGKTTLRFVSFCGPDFRWAEGEIAVAGDAESD